MYQALSLPVSAGLVFLDKEKVTVVTWGVIFPSPLVLSSSSPERMTMAKASQCTRMRKLLRCALAGLALWTMTPCRGCTPEWLWRTPYSPSCSPQAHRSSLPRLQALPRCWAAAAAPPGSTGHCAGRRPPPAGCQSALWCLRGHRCPQWHR